MIMDLRDCAEGEPDNCASCFSYQDWRHHNYGRTELTDVHDPAETNRIDETAVPEALNVPAEGETAPRSNEVPRALPEENGYAASHDACHYGC